MDRLHAAAIPCTAYEIEKKGAELTGVRLSSFFLTCKGACMKTWVGILAIVVLLAFTLWLMFVSDENRPSSP